MNIKKIEKINIENLSISDIKTILYRSLSGLNLEDIFINTLNNDKRSVTNTEKYSNLVKLRKHIEKEDFENKDFLISEIKNKEKEIILKFVPLFNKIAHLENIVKGKEEKKLYIFLLESLYKKYNVDSGEMIPFKEYMLKYVNILENIESFLPKEKDFIIYFMENFRKKANRIDMKKIEEYTNVKQKEFINLLKLSISDLHGIDAIIKEDGKSLLVDIKSSYNSNLSIEQFSDINEDKKGWIKNTLTQQIVVGNFKKTNNKDLDNIKKLFLRYKEAYKLNDEKEIIKIAEDFNFTVDKIKNLEDLKIEYSIYDFKDIKKIEKFIESAETKLKKEFENGNFNIDNKFFKVIKRAKSSEDKINKFKQLDLKSFVENQERLEKTSEIIEIENKIINSKIIVGCIIDNKYYDLVHNGVNLFNSSIQGKLQGHKQNNISKSFKIDKKHIEKALEFANSMEKREDYDINEIFKEKITLKSGLRIKKKIKSY